MTRRSDKRKQKIKNKSNFLYMKLGILSVLINIKVYEIIKN